MRTIGRKLTYANVISTLALFLALSGGAFAAAKLAGSSGVLNLCVSKSGAVKALGHQHKCSSGSHLTTVNEQGPTGATGPPGPAGAPSPAYAAGSGLTLSGTTLGADLSQLQARIAGSGCGADQVLQSVSQPGAPTCTGLHAYSGQPEPDFANANIAVPPGHWALFGQVTFGVANGNTTVYCSIEVGGKTVATASQSVPAHENGSVSFTSTATTTTLPATAVGTNCHTEPSMLGTWSDGQILALPVAALN
jgi:hypothetical protein